MDWLRANLLSVSCLPRINTMELDKISDIQGKTAREAAGEFQSMDKSLLPIYHKPFMIHETNSCILSAREWS